MNIKKQIRLSVLVSLILAIAISGSIVVSYQNIQDLQRQESFAADVVRGSYELTYLSNDYIVNAGPRARLQWEGRYASLQPIISQLKPENNKERQSLETIRNYNEKIGTLFHEIAQPEVLSDGTVRFSPDYQQIMWSRSNVQEQGLIYEAWNLRHLYNDDVTNARFLNDILIVALIVAMLVIIGVNYLLISRRLVQSIREVNVGSEVFATGDLDYRIPVTSDDEIGGIARRLNTMAEQIRNVTASRNELNREIDERKRVELALRQNYEELERGQQAVKESEAKYHLIADNADDWIYWIAPDGKFRYISPSCKRITGYSAAEFSNHPQLITEIVHLEDRDAILHHFGNIQEVNDPDYLEYRIITKNGEIRWISHSCSPIYTKEGKYAGRRGTNRNITERKRAEEDLNVKNTDLEAAYEEITATEEELRQNYEELAKSEQELKQSEEKYQLIADNADDWIYWIAPNGTLRYISPSCERVTGYSPTEFLEHPQLLKEIAHPADRVIVQDHFSGVNEDSAHDYLEYRITTKNGEERWISHSCNPIYTHEGHYAGRRGTNRNITDRKHAEDELRVKNTDLEAAYEEITATGEELRQLNEELEERVRQRTDELVAANKELESFTYSVSHDLRAPLRAIHGFSRILMEEHAIDLSPDIQRYLTIINENGLRMGNLIDDLLAFSRTSRQSLKLQVVQPNEIVSQCFAELKSEQDGRSVEITITDLPACRADPSLLKRVWFNLISNALKFTRKKETARITIGSQQGADGTIYFIKDNGAGFDMKYVGKLFGVFQRLHHVDEFEGSGVGLAIVKMIVTRHGGTVWAEAEVEKGATFFFTFERREIKEVDGNG